MSGQGNSATPTVVITSVEQSAADTTAMSLLFDLPKPVVVTHSFGADGTSLVRTVSDVTGLLDRTTIDLEHACVPCAIREDVLPTIAGLASSGHWSSIIARLPIGAEATQLCRVASYEPNTLGGARIAAVVNAVDGCDAVRHLTGPELLVERELPTFEGDVRGTAEVATTLLEYADVIAVDGELMPECSTLVRTLARPGAQVVENWSQWDATALLPGVHDVEAIEKWVAETPPAQIGDSCEDGVWRVRLRSERAVHPERIQENLAELGGGAFRTRGCFWVPTRPETLCVWDGAAGQLNIGTAGRWRRPAARRTDFVVTGLLAHGDPRDELRRAFETALCTPAELDTLAAVWSTDEDGLEPWLGDMKEYH